MPLALSALILNYAPISQSNLIRCLAWPTMRSSKQAMNLKSQMTMRSKNNGSAFPRVFSGGSILSGSGSQMLPEVDTARAPI